MCPHDNRVDARDGEARAEPVDGIAVIGMSGRFPGAKNVHRFWQILRDGVEAVSSFTDEELEAAGVEARLRSHPSYVRAGAVLDDPDLFDASFFGFSPRDAEVTDPQQRLFLEVCWEALESAGYDPRRRDGVVGVYGGMAMSSYLINNLLTNPEVLEAVGIYQVILSNDKDYLANRVSYKLDLRGPSMVLQCACSTSLVAVNTACDSLVERRCDVALAGGVSVFFPQKRGYMYRPGMILSPDGHCRAFDARAEGVVGGSGVGVVALKRLQDALADGDPVLAVIRGWAVNNDGADKVGYTAPSVEGQAEVITEALAMSGVDPDTVGYVEAHGTGTRLGDPVEVAALNLAYGRGTGRTAPCYIGSLKTNFGHMDSAAGIAGFIKAVLAVRNGEIPPSLHYERPNPSIPFDEGPFEVSTRLRAWEANGVPRRAAVSAFGIGGTNAHTIVEEAPSRAASSGDRSRELLVLSARTASALERMTSNLADHLEAHPGLSLADVAWTLQTGRQRMIHHRTLACTDVQDAVTLLRGGDTRRVHTWEQEGRDRHCAFLFSGQGAQHPNMARSLYEQEDVFRSELDLYCEILEPLLGTDLRGVVFPPSEGESEAAELLKQTRLTQPALFAVELALARLWMAWGVAPDAMLGHSIGEYVAACLAGVFPVEVGLSIVAARGAAMDEMPAGSMLAVQLPASELAPHLVEPLSLAAVNAPSLSVVSGPHQAVDELEAILSAQGVQCSRLRTSHAFHSSMMQPAADAFRRHLEGIELHEPSIPFISNVSGTWITNEQATSADYWALQLRSPVRLAEGLDALLDEPERVLLEVGPGNSLTSLAALQGERSRGRSVFASLPHPKTKDDAASTVLDTLGHLWAAGVTVDWDGFRGGRRRLRVPLPTYPFEGKRYWLEPGGRAPDDRVGPGGPIKTGEIADWFYVPSWKRAMPASRPGAAGPDEDGDAWLVFDNGGELSAAVLRRLERDGARVSVVRQGDAYQHVDGGAYTIEPGDREAYTQLLADLEERGALPRRVVHLWSLRSADAASEEEGFDPAQRVGLYSIVHLISALHGLGSRRPEQLGVVASGLHHVVPGDQVTPANATLLGALAVVRKEVPGIRSASIDIGGLPVDVERARIHATWMVDEMLRGLNDPVVAYRGDYRWIRTFERHPLDAASAACRIREGGTYLITGGLGGVGLSVARRLAQDWKVRLVLVGRSGFPAREEWNAVLRWAGQDGTAALIRSVMALEEAGSEVFVASADVASPEALRRVVDTAQARFGRIDGVIHAAGIVAGSSFRELRQLGRSDFADQFRAKVHGVYALEAAFRGREPDFFLLASSLSCILGGVAFGAYASANSFLEAFARSRRAEGGAAWIPVLWDGWLFGGSEHRDDRTAPLAMDPEEGAETLVRVLGMERPEAIVVSVADLDARFDRSAPPRATATEAATEADRPATERSASSGPRNRSMTDVERAIASVWGELLGIGDVGPDDDFFQLGGHSLLASQMAWLVGERLGTELPAQIIYDAPTVAELAQRVEAAHRTEDDAPTRAVGVASESFEL